jgi:hypothetical protein
MATTGPALPRVGARPLWACPSGLASGARTSFFPREGVRCHHVLPQAAKEANAGPTLPCARGRRPSVGR